MTHIHVFKYKNFQFRATLINDEPWFFSKDAVKCLGYESYLTAMTEVVEERDQLSFDYETDSGNRSAVVVNISGLSRLICGSRIPDAEEFKCWCEEVVFTTLREYIDSGIEVLEATVKVREAEVQLCRAELELREAELRAAKRELEEVC